FGGAAARHYCHLPVFTLRNQTLPSAEMYASFDGVTWFFVNKVTVNPAPVLKELKAPPGLTEGGLYRLDEMQYGDIFEKGYMEIGTVMGENFVPGCNCLFSSDYVADGPGNQIVDLMDQQKYAVSEHSTVVDSTKIMCAFPPKLFFEKFLVSVACPPTTIAQNSLWFIPPNRLPKIRQIYPDSLGAYLQNTITIYGHNFHSYIGRVKEHMKNKFDQLIP
ncbi:unnamed protein product, partial [Amoebophrya sp. A120]